MLWNQVQARCQHVVEPHAGSGVSAVMISVTLQVRWSQVHGVRHVPSTFVAILGILHCVRQQQQQQRCASQVLATVIDLYPIQLEYLYPYRPIHYKWGSVENDARLQQQTIFASATRGMRVEQHALEARVQAYKFRVHARIAGTHGKTYCRTDYR